jgi:uncharacterized protein (DUF934 family)
MRQILRQRELSVDTWRYPGEPAPAADAGAAGACARQVLTLPEWLAAAGAGTAMPGGVEVGPNDDVLQLAPGLARLELVVVRFEKLGDGRGYTQGQVLRQQLGFTRELRARGVVRRDMLFLLARCGFDSFDFEGGEDAAAALAHLDRFSLAYQPSSGTLVRPRVKSWG